MLLVAIINLSVQRDPSRLTSSAHNLGFRGSVMLVDMVCQIAHTERIETQQLFPTEERDINREYLLSTFV